MTLKKESKGFTLIELMVVMAIIAVLSTLIIGAVQLARSTATETAHRSNGKTIQTALEGHFAKYREYCSSTSAANELACASATQASPKSYTFDQIAGTLAGGWATNLKVKLATSSTTGSCATEVLGNLGGGKVTVYPGGYTITPQNSKCDNDLTSDVLTMP